MDTKTEIDQLKQEVAQLKQQMRELRSCITIETLEKQPQHKIMHLRCCTISFVNPSDPQQNQGIFCSTEDGPSLTLSGDDGRPRLTIDVHKNQGHIGLYHDDMKSIVDIGLDERNNAQVGVFHEGKPRAVLKGTATMGAISAVHDDGAVRAYLSGHFDHGEMMVVGGDLKPAVKISADGPEGGGYLTVNHSNGKAALILLSSHLGGGIFSSDSRGAELDIWPRSDRRGDEP